MRAADLVRRIWRDAPPATVATTATSTPDEPCVSQLSQLSQPSAPGKLGGNVAPVAPVANVATVAGVSEPANDTAPTHPLQPRPAVLRQPQHPGNAAEEALAVLDKLHAWGIVLTLDGNLLQPHGLDTLPPLMREEVDALMHPAVYGRDLIAAVQARDAAMAAIEQASLQRCWGCSCLQPSRQGNPQCTSGHTVAWREVNPGLRIMPLRVSKAGPCADYRQEDTHGD